MFSFFPTCQLYLGKREAATRNDLERVGLVKINFTGRIHDCRACKAINTMTWPGNG